MIHLGQARACKVCLLIVHCIVSKDDSLHSKELQQFCSNQARKRQSVGKPHARKDPLTGHGYHELKQISHRRIKAIEAAFQPQRNAGLRRQ
jgi:hypothetical protein